MAKVTSKYQVTVPRTIAEQYKILLRTIGKPGSPSST
jgi:bifunctional DNA-binding transcriptional regulator/antitoxin component of YhaV-PrlF toxin-antitoxin module